MSEKYKEVGDEMVDLPSGKHFFELACCDCGLVHRIYYATPTPEEDKLQIAFERDDRATAQLRRHNHGELQKEDSVGRWKMVRKDK